MCDLEGSLSDNANQEGGAGESAALTCSIPLVVKSNAAAVACALQIHLTMRRRWESACHSATHECQTRG